MKKEKVILFDLDGTLIDSTDAILESFYNSFKVLKFDFKGNDEDIKNEIGYPLDVMYANLGVKPEDIELFVDTYKEHYRIVSGAKTFLLDGAKESVLDAKKIATLGVVTTKTTRYSIPLLENLEILQYFDVIIGRQEVTNPKPHPEPIFKAMQSLKVSPQTHDIYMIGDTKLDLIASNEANVKPIGVLCGYGSKEQLAPYTNDIFIDAKSAVKHISLQ